MSDDPDYDENTRLAYDLNIWDEALPPPDGVPESDARVTHAEYGANGHVVDVTAQVVGRTRIVVGNSVFHCDPCPGVVKVLTVDYMVGPLPYRKVIPEGTVGTLP